MASRSRSFVGRPRKILDALLAIFPSVATAATAARAADKISISPRLRFLFDIIDTGILSACSGCSAFQERETTTTTTTIHSFRFSTNLSSIENGAHCNCSIKPNFIATMCAMNWSFASSTTVDRLGSSAPVPFRLQHNNGAEQRWVCRCCHYQQFPFILLPLLPALNFPLSLLHRFAIAHLIWDSAIGQD